MFGNCSLVGWVVQLMTIKAFNKGIKILANGLECLLKHVWAKLLVVLIFGVLAVKSSGVLEHAGSGSVKRWDPRLGVAWLSSCKIVRFEYSYCFCSCLWVLVSMSPSIHTLWKFLHISLIRIGVYETYAIGWVMSKPLIMACGNGLNLYWWDSKELICFRHCIVWPDFLVFLTANWCVTGELGSWFSAAKSLRSWYNRFLLSYVGLCQLHCSSEALQKQLSLLN